MAELKSDYNEVMLEVSEQLLGRLTADEDGSIIDVFETRTDDPWQSFLHFGALEHALRNHRTDKRCKTVFIYVQPEGLVGAADAVTPVRTLMKHLVYERIEDVSADRLQFAEILFDGKSLSYEGAELKGRHCVLVCDLASVNSPYLKECIALCQEKKAAHTLAIPMMTWDEKEFAQTKEGKHQVELAKKRKTKAN